MGGFVLYSHTLLPHCSSFSTPNFRNPFLISLKEIRGVDAKFKGPNGNNAQPLDGRSSSSSSSNKEEILALFKRIQSSISKDETTNSKSSNSKDSILGKGKKLGKKGDKRKDSPKKEDEKTDRSSTTGFLKSTRPPSSFTRRSPIPTQPSRGNKTEPGNERLPERVENENSERVVVNKFEEMKLAELKEVAKCKGIKGYSKLKKSELVDLLIRSLGNITS